MAPTKPHPAESLAAKHHAQMGLTLVEQNYHSRFDVVALDKDHQIQWVKDAFNAG